VGSGTGVTGGTGAAGTGAGSVAATDFAATDFDATVGSVGAGPERGLVRFGALAAITARPHSPQNIAPAGRVVPQ
jgi:hypothetical protein